MRLSWWTCGPMLHGSPLGMLPTCLSIPYSSSSLHEESCGDSASHALVSDGRMSKEPSDGRGTAESTESGQNQQQQQKRQWGAGGRQGTLGPHPTSSVSFAPRSSSRGAGCSLGTLNVRDCRTLSQLSTFLSQRPLARLDLSELGDVVMVVRGGVKGAEVLAASAGGGRGEGTGPGRSTIAAASFASLPSGSAAQTNASKHLRDIGSELQTRLERQGVSHSESGETEGRDLSEVGSQAEGGSLSVTSIQEKEDIQAGQEQRVLDLSLAVRQYATVCSELNLDPGPGFIASAAAFLGRESAADRTKFEAAETLVALCRLPSLDLWTPSSSRAASAPPLALNSSPGARWADVRRSIASAIRHLEPSMELRQVSSGVVCVEPCTTMFYWKSKQLPPGDVALALKILYFPVHTFSPSSGLAAR